MSRKATQKPKSLNQFSGYPAELIARWCGVSVQTAEHYKAGRRKPSRRVMMLFRLHADGRVLGPEWKGFVVKGNKIFQPNGKHITPSMFEHWELMWQLAAAKDPEGMRRLLDSLSA